MFGEATHWITRQVGLSRKLGIEAVTIEESLEPRPFAQGSRALQAAAPCCFVMGGKPKSPASEIQHSTTRAVERRTSQGLPELPSSRMWYIVCLVRSSSPIH